MTRTELSRTLFGMPFTLHNKQQKKSTSKSAPLSWPALAREYKTNPNLNAHAPKMCEFCVLSSHLRSILDVGLHLAVYSEYVSLARQPRSRQTGRSTPRRSLEPVKWSLRSTTSKLQNHGSECNLRAAGDIFNRPREGSQKKSPGRTGHQSRRKKKVRERNGDE